MAPSPEVRAEYCVQVPKHEAYCKTAESDRNDLPHDPENLEVASIISRISSAGLICTPSRRSQVGFHHVHAPEEDDGSQQREGVLVK